MEDTIKWQKIIYIDVYNFRMNNTCSNCFIVTPMAIDRKSLSAFKLDAFLMSPKAIGTIDGFTDTITISDFCTTGTFSNSASAPRSYV